MKVRILLVDDDHGPMEYFVSALRHRGFEVEHIDTVDIFFQRLDSVSIPPDFHVAVVDMMIPHGQRLTKEETDGGLKSGVLIMQALREKFPHLPILALTNYNEPEVLALLPSDAKVKAKFEISPFEFADFVQTIIHAAT